jgi:signal transduction histidine kinase
MSHELRTPLNSVMGFAQILEYDHGNPLNERQRYAVDMIRKSSEFLLELIKGVLDLSRIETGTIGMQIKAVNPVSIVNDSIAATQALAAARDITMIGLDSELRMKQVLLNLLSNAVKYNNDGGSVTVHAAVADHDKVRISVTDTGSGIAEDVHDKVFAPFDRLGRETLEIEGTGVGLTITKSLVEYMDGEIGFASSPGEGSTFWIEIPVWEEAPQQELRTVHH